MTTPAQVDGNLQHLYAPFRALVEAVLLQANKECAEWLPQGATLKVYEGYRSTARQEWLYAQGRTRAGSIVTDKRVPDHHGHGLACDIVIFSAEGEPSWDGPDALWAQLGHCARAHGLFWGGDWAKLGDVYHVQPLLAQMTAWQAGADHYLHTLGLTTP